MSSDIDFESDLWLIEVTDDESASSSEFENDDYSLRSIPLFSNLYISIYQYIKGQLDPYYMSNQQRQSPPAGTLTFTDD